MPTNSFARLLLKSAFCVAGIASLAVTGASAQARSRIVGPIAESNSVAIAHSIHPRTKLGADLGPTTEDRLLRGMSIRFNMTDAQAAALDQLLSDQQNPASPRYQQWLTPAQYAAQFGMSAGDVAKVSAWLTSCGFTVTSVDNGGTILTFDGTVSQVQRAFATSIHNLSVDGETHFANVAEVLVPSAFAGAVTTVTGLHDFYPKPRIHTGLVSPAFTSSFTGNHFIAPGDLYTIYGMNALLNNFHGNGIGTGSNCLSSSGTQCADIAITGRVDIITTDVSAFRSAAGLNANLPVTILAGADPGQARSCISCTGGQGDLAESSLDLEWAGAMAPGATIDFVTGVDIFNNSLTYAITHNLAPIVTTSYGACEAGQGSNEILSLNGLLKQANAQGQTVIAAAGDNGAPDCDGGPAATQGLTADFPGSSPYVTAMGGTQFNGDAQAIGSGTNWSTTPYWTGTSGSDVVSSALSYIPEAAWNNETLNVYGGGGGGASAFFTKPTWQIGTGVPADGSRDIPDLALDASNGHDPLLYCVNGSCGNGFRISTTDSTLTPGGGTSFDSQIFGGMLALIEQKIGHRIGNANPTIYALANNLTYYVPGATVATSPNVVFNDVTTGNNSEPCSAGSPNCGSGGVIGFSAGRGYDLATGWGSVNVTNLANAWSLVTPLCNGLTNVCTGTSQGTAISTTALTASSSNATVGSSNVTLTATVSGGAGTATGTVQFFANGVSLGSPVTLSGGMATFSWVTTCSALGQQVLSASYSGDVNYQGSKGPVLPAGPNGTATPVEVQVNSSTCPDFALSTATPTVSVAAGGTIPSVIITATPLNGFTGTVTFSATSISSTLFAPTLTFSPASVTLNSSTAATSTLTFSGITADLRMPSAPGSEKTPWYAGSGITVAALLLLVVPGKRRLGGLLFVALAIALIGGTTGCGSSQAGPPATSTNPQAGTYTVVVTGTYTSSSNQVTQHTTTVNYSIQ